MPHPGRNRHPQKSPSTPTYVRGRAHPIGFVAGGVFYKQLRKRHFLTTPPGIGFDRSTLRDAERAGASSIHIANSDTGATYTASIDDVWRWGYGVNRGYGDQIALALTRWSVNGGPVAATYESNQAVTEKQPRTAQQMWDCWVDDVTARQQLELDPRDIDPEWGDVPQEMGQGYE